MSVANRFGEKVMLSRTGRDQVWKEIHAQYAGEGEGKWRLLAMLSLHETAGWPLEQVGMAFNHHKGHVQRCIEQLKGELQRRFEVSWDREGEGFSDPGERRTRKGERKESERRIT